MPAGWITGLRGVDLGTPDVAASARFYTEVWRLDRVAERATLHHIAFEMADIDSVMRGAGRMRDAGYPIEWGLGRHGPGNNVFAYFVGPDDFVIEYTAEIEQVTDATPVRTPADWVYPRGHSDLWGATPPPSERMKAAQKKIGFADGLFHP
jgi:catechol 2,3-dioxygenase